MTRLYDSQQNTYWHGVELSPEGIENQELSS